MRLRIFLTCWIVFALHFATNVVREHYPAFSLIEHGTFQCDDYAGFHSDIFEHTDGHHYIGNQVLGSVVAAVPLLAFDPLLDHLEAIRKREPPPEDGGGAEYDTEYPMRRAFFRKVRERGLDLRFGASTVVTSAFLMAPLSALLVLLVFDVLSARGVRPRRAAWLAFLCAFATPVFYRSASLNHNLMLTLSVFGAFLALWPREGESLPLSPARRFTAGLLAGCAVAFDYAGVVPLLAFTAYLLWTHGRAGGVGGALRALPAYVLGGVPPAVFLLWSQWTMYGDPFLPGQFWMPDQNQYVDDGVRGMTVPDVEVFLQNLFDPDWGMYAFAPLLLIGLWPTRDRGDVPLVLPRRERRFVALFVLGYMLFCAMNQYSRLQWNTGFRYLLTLVPFVFLQASDHLARMRTWVLAVVTVPVVLHSWVLGMVRYTPPVRGDPHAVTESWRRVLTEGVQLPWLNVLSSTSSLPVPFLRSPLAPYAFVALAAVMILAVWRFRRPADGFAD